MSLDEIVTAVKAYNPEADFERIGKAYRFAQECHKDQFRASGESYFIHPEAVAMIVAQELRLDSTSICAALLHDVVEDTAATLQDLEAMFGPTLAQLVEGVTKLNKMFFSSATAAQAVNFRKMLFAMTNDVRVILIKLADRLHNLRTLQYLPPVKQKYVAKETLEIYAPLAHRLGINKIKSQLEELSFQILQPDQYKEISEFLVKQGLEGDAKLQEALHQIDKHLREVHIHADLSGRPKQIFSIWGKMQKHNLTLEGLYDFLGVRILTKSVKDCYGALGIVHKFWKPIPGRFKDYIAVPKPNMYQSLHTTVIYDGRPLEVQIRTEEMHRISEEGIAAHWDYKESSGKEATPDYKEKLSWLRNLIDWYQDAKDASEFMETVKVELFQYHVYVFTPKGDVVELPKGSTPVDFGYHIHTDVGHRCIGAKVNGHIVPLEYSLQNGDIVSIITSKIQKGPSRDWLKFVQSTNAKKKIRAWLKKEFREEFVGNGEKEFLETLSRMGGTKEEEKKIKLPAFVEEIKNIGFPNLDELYAGIGAGEVRAQQVIGKLFPDLVPRQAPPVVPSAQQPQRKPDREHRRKARKGPRIIAGGIESAEVKISRCCNPIPGDPIMGYITRGRGVTVHRTDCPNAKELYKQPEGRLIDVRWDMGVQVEQVDQSYRTRMRVETTDRPGMLNAVTSVISNQGVNIYSANARTTKQRTGVLDFSIEVANAQQLQALIRALLRVNGVTKVFRSDSPSSKDEA
ncbi:MAG TPA: bifunctional (p)ppGpp synthetase/guanosine-3',5'-bis(diphosphate) 3'-pyrophosphohydrolase [Candidatus Ozemobacteraceae bacterium]|nr:bifunctional (p)ppGpp synthetase/guanosine-3',5'-bis(diphosphate) 3'-pyrophosphohydrolase [Candidatus Ozemobacteraceae bacterium]